MISVVCVKVLQAELLIGNDLRGRCYSRVTIGVLAKLKRLGGTIFNTSTAVAAIGGAALATFRGQTHRAGFGANVAVNAG